MRLNKRKIELWLIDTGIFAIVYLLMENMERFGFQLAVGDSGRIFLKFLLMYVCIMIIRFFFGVYNSVWRYANVMVYLKMSIADVLGGIFFILLGTMMPRFAIGMIYSVLAILLIMFMTFMTRVLYQTGYAYAGRRSDENGIKDGNPSDNHKINVAIVGAGNVGTALAEELLRNPRSHYNPYCFIDNDVNKIGNEVNGIRIISEKDHIVEKIRRMPVQEIIIALPDASMDARARLYEKYKETACKVKLYDYPLGESGEKIGKPMLREFKIEDLLFRDMLKVNSEDSRKFYSGKTVLVTGGGGSIGSELCRQIAKLNPAKLIIVDIYENNAYEIQQELIRKYNGALNLRVYIASVRDVKRLDEIFRTERPDMVFHAAAHKHVPLMEDSSCEAIKNNVMGTYNTANMAEKYHVQKFLLISTDKAVNPTNIMGASKRLCEMVIQCRHDSQTEFTAVRFGNVLGSNGSVIPLFKKQIQNGGPITLTDKRIIRYFMTIPEAVGLVMETGAMAHNGELYVLDMGKPVKILDLAEEMIRLSGLKPYIDIDIIEIGLRPGEKLYEELLMKTEELDKTSNDLIFIEKDKGISREEMEEKLKILLAAVEEEGYENVRAAIRATVPTYHTPEEVNKKAAEAREMQMVNGAENA